MDTTDALHPGCPCVPDYPQIGADQYGDDVRLSDLESKFVCTVCGNKGADVRPDWDWDKEPVRQTGFRACRGH